jgi:FAD binding domain
MGSSIRYLGWDWSLVLSCSHSASVLYMQSASDLACDAAVTIMMTELSAASRSFMNLMLGVAILTVSPVRVSAQEQRPNVEKLKADAQNVFKIISGDKLKIRTYCEIADLSVQLAQATRKKDSKKVEKLAQNIGELELAEGTPRGLRDDLVALLGPDRVLSRPIDLIRFATDASPYRLFPKVVVIARTVDDVHKVLEYARQRHESVTFRAAGTSLSGQAQGDGPLRARPFGQSPPW